MLIMDLLETTRITTISAISLVIVFNGVLIAGFFYFRLAELSRSLFAKLASAETKQLYQTVIQPYQAWLIWAMILAIIDLLILSIPRARWVNPWEFPLGLIVAANISILGFKLFQKLFDHYLLDSALENKDQINSELLVLAKYVSNAVIILITVVLFAQFHNINLVGLLASLGLGGVAIAFASQRILEQIIWSIVLYIDSPFLVGDYIHLGEEALGKVESIGWRSTKIRLSGKNTLVIVPNSSLAQINIENLTRARREILIVDLTFLRAMSDEEKALIRQLILDSTSDILGIDSQLTQVTFRDVTGLSVQDHVQGQAIFFLLGAAETSMELRRSLLEIARSNIIDKLNSYGITFKLEERITDIRQPMNI